jgi:hypothetical protein
MALGEFEPGPEKKPAKNAFTGRTAEKERVGLRVLRSNRLRRVLTPAFLERKAGRDID